MAERAKLLEQEPEGAGDEPIQAVKFPGQIPAALMTPSMREEIQSFLIDELSTAEGERSGFMRNVARWQEAYAAPMSEKPKHFPIYNASNLIMPVIKESVNTLTAQLVQATDTARPRWIFKDLAKEWDPFIDSVEKFLDMASDRDMNLSVPFTDWIVECGQLGTSLLEVPWEVDERKIYKYDETGKRCYPSRVILKDGPDPRHVPLQKFWIRFNERDVQRARWISTELEFSEADLRRGSARAKLHSIDKILAAGEKRSTDIVTKVQEKIEDTTPIKRNHTIHKVWLSWDIDGDGVLEETMLYFHRETNLLVGEYFNPYWHGKRPFVKIGFFPRPDRFYDEGLCEMLEQLQSGISAMANKRADNAGIANAKMFLKRRTVRNFMPGDPLYSGKIIEVNDPLSDVRELPISDVYPSTVQEEALLQQRVERVAGTNEGVAGAAMPVTRTTASAQIALLQEQAKRIDLTVRDIRRGMGEVGNLTLQLYGQFGTQGKSVAWLGEKGYEVEAVLRMPRRLKELGMALHAQTPTSMQNKQVQRENKLALFNLLMQLHERVFPLAQAFAPPETLPMVATGAIQGAQKFMSDIFRLFEEPDPEGVLASLAVLERVLPRMENLGGMDDLERGVQVADILDRVSGLERIAGEAEALAAGSRGISDGSRNGKRAHAPEGVSPGLAVRDLVGGAPD